MRLFPLLLIFWNLTTVHPTKNYCTICPGGSHIMCKYKTGQSPACLNYKSSAIDSDEAKASIVDIHNQFRSRVAQGLEQRGNPGPQPSASNMLMLQWDNELAEIAQRIADQCFDPKEQFTDDCRLTERFSYGIMIASLVHKKDAALDFAYTFNFWYNNVQLFSASKASKFEMCSNKSLNGFRYYTQIVWAETHAIGCGHAAFEQNTTFRGEKQAEPHFLHRLVCNYAPIGNIVGAPVYKIGEPCSLCPEGYGCSADYPGLCTNVSHGPIVVEDGLNTQVEIDFSNDLNGTRGAPFPGRWKPKLIPTRQTPKPESNKVNDDDKIAASKRQRLYNEGDECYCGYLMRAASSDRSLILDDSIIVVFILSSLIVLMFV